MMFLSGIVGFLTATAVNKLGLDFLEVNYVSPALALIVDYAGGDFLENIYKTIIKKPSLYSFPEDLKKKQED